MSNSHSDYYGDGGRLDGKPSDVLIETAYQHDCDDAEILIDGLHKADLAHATMLIKKGVIPKKEGQRLLLGLLELESIPASKFPVDPKNGDVYNSKDVALRALIGDTAGWLHIGRPRREAVNIGYILAVRSRLQDLSVALNQFASELLSLAKRNKDVIAPDFTYLLHAHPTRLGHYLTTFLFGILRDQQRITEHYSRLNCSPAGSGSVNGSALPIDRNMLSDLLGFDRVISHTRDAMWQVDTPMEMMSVMTMMMTNINRLADELQIWNTEEFGSIDLPDELCRASVIMPQKKNPYPLAYVRGVTSSLLGQFSNFAAYGKGPSGNPDSRIFIYGELPRAMDKVTGALNLFSEVLKGLKFNEDVLRNRVAKSYAFATDFADYLTYKKKIDYRTAHQISGRLVKLMIDKNIAGDRLSQKLIDTAARDIIGKKLAIPKTEIDKLKDPEIIAKSRRTIGGAGDAPLKKLFSEAEQSISDFENWIGNLKSESYYDVLDAEVSGLVFSDASFVERVQKSVKKFPKKQAIIEGGDRIFTYRQLWAQAQLIAKTLGNRAGQRIALRIDDKPNLIAAIIGVQLSGATVISLDVSDKASINMMLKDCDPGVVMYRDAAIDPKTRVAVSKTRKKVSWIEIPDIDDIGNTPIDQKLKLPKVDKNTIAHMFYTSGTTGHRKGVSISQSAYIAPANSLNRGMSYDETVREYVVGNISHAFPFGRVRAVLFVGGTVVLNNGGVQPRLVLNMLEASNCNAIGAPASVIIMLTARFRDAFAALSKQLNWIKMGTQAVPPEIKTSLLEMFPETKIFQQYGASESPRTVLNNIGTASTLETTGRVLPGYKVSIRDPEGKILLDRRQKGRVWLKGPHIATGYWRNKKKTNESFNDGWFITDDIGQLDDEGQLTLFGRVDEIINFGGQKLSPQDIENVLSKFLKNEKFVVFGVKDPSGLLGEVPAIVFEKGDTEFSEDADWPKKRIAITKEIGKTVPFIPKQAFKISKIPMTGSGKPKRKILSAMAQSNPG